MPLKTILVPLSGAETDPVALKAAMAIARDFNAHVTALFVKLDPRDAVPMLGEGMSGAMVEEIMRSAEAEANVSLIAARRHFEAVVADASVELSDTPLGVEGPTASWHEVVGRIDEVVPVEGRLSDLLVFAVPSGGEASQAMAAIETALLSAGRPLLLVPKDAPATIGRAVAISWNGNAEAARAVAGAMPFIANADAVSILTAETSVTQPAAGRRIADYLAWHRVDAQLTIVKPGSEPVGKALMDRATGLGCDLLVMGGYGHSRMREMILGGVTRYVLNHAGLPVLMAH